MAFDFLKNRILNKLIAIIATAVTLISIPVSIYFSQSSAETMQANLRRSIEVLVNISELGYASPVWSLNNTSVHLMNKAVLANDSVVAVNVFQNDEFMESLSKDLSNFKIISSRRHQAFVIPAQYPEIKSASSDIRFNDQIIGRFEIFYTERFIFDAIRQSNINIALSFAITALLIIAATFLTIKKSIIRPVLALSDFTKKIASGDDYSERVKSDSHDEIAALYDSFNQMLQNIQQRKSELKNSIANLRLAEQKYRSIFENSLDGIFQSNPQGKLLTVNPAMAELLGYDSVDDPRLTCIDDIGFTLYADHTKRQEFLDLMTQYGSVSDFELEILRQDGSNITVAVNAHISSWENGQISCFEGTMRDITERKQAERELQKYRASLEQMVRERTEDLDQKNIALHETVQKLQSTLTELQFTQNKLVQSEKLAALGALVAGIAHELNTPVGNSLLAASALDEKNANIHQALATALKRSTLEAYLADTRFATDIILRNLQRAAELIASFKQVAADQTSSQRRCFKLNEVVEENLIALRPTLGRTPYLITKDIPDNIGMNSFPGPLGQILTNLINNAIIHGFEGRQTGTVSIKAQQIDAKQIEITVNDDGRGIPEAHLKRIFDPFFTTKLGQGGSGIGLSIVHSIVTGVLGGDIRVDSSEHGTCFTLLLPNEVPATITSLR